MTAYQRFATTFAVLSLGLAAQATGQTVRQFEVPGELPVALYRPASVEPGVKAPLVFLLHGSSGDGPSILSNSGLQAAADKHGFIIAAPTGAIHLDKGFAWNVPGVATVSGKAPGAGDRDDVKYMLSILDALVKQGSVDRSRVYATGISGGGRMTSWLGCVASTRFAAIAPVVGLRAGTPLKSDPARPDPESCQPESALPIIAFAGNKDTVNPMEGGGARYWQYSMRSAEIRWATLNHCQTSPVTRVISPALYQERYDGCRDNAEVTAYITEGGGHSWLADNEVMWAFFKSYARAEDGKLLKIAN
jgi:polyhydroxybutyrate depolymerase